MRFNQPFIVSHTLGLFKLDSGQVKALAQLVTVLHSLAFMLPLLRQRGCLSCFGVDSLLDLRNAIQSSKITLEEEVPWLGAQ